MPRRVRFIAPVLPADVLATARILEQSDLLESLMTRGVTTPVTRGLSSRAASPVAKRYTKAKWIPDLVFYMTLALTRSRLRATDASFACLDQISARGIGHTVGAVLAREDCCLQTFRRAKHNGITTIYQLPTAYWRAVRELIEREIAEFPGICRAASDSADFAADRTERKDAELECSDHVLCPSTFVCNSLTKYRSGTHTIIPFAIDNGAAQHADRPSRPVFLYAGNITMRKGVHRLLFAWKKLKAHRTHELRLVGDMFLSAKFLQDFKGIFTHVPRLVRDELNQHYRQASALVFNPVADGFGYVILEAMGCGTPVIASRNCGAPDTITNRVEGLLVDYGDQNQLISALDFALSNPAELSDMGKAASERVRKYTWKDYGERFLTWLRPLLE